MQPALWTLYQRIELVDPVQQGFVSPALCLIHLAVCLLSDLCPASHVAIEQIDMALPPYFLHAAHPHDH